ncbi:MAG TPA: sulfatase-like hydrolase/transferase [Bryobacteraceae bacterium]|nr:sulfatase-like hydrolase/transferase [Bryobacteraceae bacterium]
MNPLVILIPAGAVCGLLSALLFRSFSSQGTRQTLDRAIAHVMELRLFIDEPSLVLKAQRDLIREDARLLRQIALPVLLSALLFGIVIWPLDRICGHGALPAGRAVVVTAGVDSAELEAPAGVVIETPGVRIAGAHEVSWRIRPKQPFRGNLGARGAGGRLYHVDVPWPRATILGINWLVWFFAFSFLAAPLAALLPKRSYLNFAMIFAFVCPTLMGAEKPPVILISIDTLRADRVGAGTPGISSYASHGTVYRQIDAQVPLTLPSHTVLMTSQYPFATGVELNDRPVPPGIPTLASTLRGEGYATAAFTGSFVLNRTWGLDQGFDVYDSPFAATRVRRDGALVIRAARQWMEKNHERPAFVFIHLYDLHTPYPVPGMEGMKPNGAGYEAQLQHVDQVLAGFRDFLVRDGWWDKSLVLVLSDHGESLGDHGESAHGYFVYEATLHVPLIVHWPAGAPPRPQSVDQPGGLIDVAPAILDFLNIPAPPSFRGISLLREAHPVFSESVYARDTFGWAALRSLREGNYKYVDAPKPEFYDLGKDPGEAANALASHQKEAAAMKARLNQLMAEKPAQRAAGAPELSAGTRAQLGSLGYTAGAKPAASSGADPKDRLAEEEAYENGLALLYSADYAATIRVLSLVVAQDQQNLPALCALGEAHFRSGHAQRALQLWQQALDRNPAYRPAAESIGAYWLTQKNLAKACPYVPQAPQCAAAARP